MFRIGAQIGVDHNGEGYRGANVNYFNGWMDEVRVWREVRSEDAIMDAAFEIVKRDSATCL
jgi:hypothetical protein